MPEPNLVDENEEYDVPVSRVVEYVKMILASGKSDDFLASARDAGATLKVPGAVINAVKVFLNNNIHLEAELPGFRTALDCEPPCPR